MAIDLEDNYAEVTPANAEYPGGSFKNDSTGSAGDGTPVDKLWLNDWHGFFQAIRVASGMVPSGAPDTGLSSQYLNALRTLMWSPGDVKFCFRAAAEAGWLELDGKTIGNGASGATARANADTADLFAFLWQLTSLKVYTSAGVEVARGVNAFADWEANRRVALPDMRGAAPRGWDHGAGVDVDRLMGSLQLDAVQNITGTLGVDDSDAVATGAFAFGAGAVPGSANDTVGKVATFDASRVVRTANETRMRNVAGMFVIKL